MTVLIARNDALAQAQITTLNPTAANATAYEVSVNSKIVSQYTSDVSGSDQEIVEAIVADLAAALTAEVPPELLEIPTIEEDDVQVIATGLSTGKPFTLESTGAGTIVIANTQEAKSPNHWIAENFDTGTLPAGGDTVIISGLSTSQSFKYELDQNTVTLAVLRITASNQAEIGLPDYNTDGTSYFQRNYRETSLKISASVLTIGEGVGPGSRRVNLNLGTNACVATVIQTSANRPSPSEAPVHLIGANAGNSLHVISGTVDVGMQPNTGGSCNWPTVTVSGGIVRFGEGATLGVVEVAGNGYVETRSAVTTYRTRDNGRALHIGSGNITTADVAGNKLEVRATGTLTIATLNGYGGKELDLSLSDSVVTITNATIYATPDNPFTIRDPNNKLTMTNPASTPNGAQSLILITGSGKNVRLT